MKPPLARSIALPALLLVSVVLLCVMPGAAAAAGDAPMLAGDIGRSAARSLGPVQLIGLIALGFLPALFMIARARQTR